MKALFVYSGMIFRKSGKFYSLNLTESTLRKLYFPFCSELTICERIIDVEDVSGLTEINSPDIKILCPDLPISSFNLYCKNIYDYYHYIDSIILNYDFVIARQGLLGNFAAQLSRKYNIPYVYESVGSTFASFLNHDILGKILALPLTMAVKWNISKSKYVMYVTEKYLQKIYPSKGVTIGVSDVEIATQSEEVLKKRIDKINSLDNCVSLKMVTVGGVGVKVKGQRYAIKALSELNKKGFRLEYYLVGEGNYDELLNLSKSLGVDSQVHFVGSMKHDDIFEFLDDMDIYIQPSLQEGLPRAVVEAMSRGLLCLGSNIAGIPELLDRGFLFKKKNVEEIVSIIENISLDQLLSQARQNFNKAKQFQDIVLKEKRTHFWETFINNNFK